MDDNIVKTTELINKTSLSQEDKSFWLAEIKKVPQHYLFFLINFLEKCPQHFAWLTDFTKRRNKALEEGNEKEWENILKEEKEMLEKVSNEEK